LPVSSNPSTGIQNLSDILFDFCALHDLAMLVCVLHVTLQIVVSSNEKFVDYSNLYAVRNLSSWH
jgi:hypothetical protein